MTGWMSEMGKEVVGNDYILLLQIAARKYKYRKSKNRILQETIKTDYFTKYLPKYAGFSYRAYL